MENRETYETTLHLLREEHKRLKHERERVNQKYERVQAALWHLEQFLGSADEPPEDVPVSSGGIYAEMGLTEAVGHIFEFRSESPTAREVRDELANGGYPHRSARTLYASVYATLDRLRKKGLVTKDDEGRWRRVTETQPLLPAGPQLPGGLLAVDD